MKTRYIIILTGLLVAGLYAQKPTSGTVTAEVGVTGLFNVDFARAARIRYFLGDNLALRLGFRSLNQSQTEKYYQNPDGTGDQGTVKSRFSLIGFQPGAEYHFAGAEKLSTFIGAYFLVDLTNAKTEATKVSPVDLDNDGNIDGFGYNNNFNQTLEGYAEIGGSPRVKSTSIGFGLYSGFDWYLTDKLYIGAEWGLLFRNTSYSDVTITTSVAGRTTITKRAGGSEGRFGGDVIGVLRLGYQF